MSHSGPCVSYLEQICLRASGHMQLRLLSISSIIAQPQHLTTRHLLRHGQENTQISNTCVHLERQAMSISHQKPKENGPKNHILVGFLGTHHNLEITSYGTQIIEWWL